MRCRSSILLTLPVAASLSRPAFFRGAVVPRRISICSIALSGMVPQICVMLGPATAGGAYMPMFCDWVGMVEGNSSMSLASARVTEVIMASRKLSLDEMGGARVHTVISGCADERFPDDSTAIDSARELFAYLPTDSRLDPPMASASAPATEEWSGVIPLDAAAAYDMRTLIERVVDAGSFFEIKREWAPEIASALLASKVE